MGSQGSQGPCDPFNFSSQSSSFERALAALPLSPPTLPPAKRTSSSTSVPTDPSSPSPVLPPCFPVRSAAPLPLLKPAGPVLTSKRPLNKLEEYELKAYAPSRFGEVGDYMKNKRMKLQLQNREIAQTRQDGVPQIFKGLAIYINGYVQPSLQELRDMFLSHGGEYHAYLDKKSLVTHIVATNLTPAKIKEFQHRKVVTPSWIVESTQAGKLLPWSNYRWRPVPLATSTSNSRPTQPSQLTTQRSIRSFSGQYYEPVKQPLKPLITEPSLMSPSPDSITANLSAKHTLTVLKKQSSSSLNRSSSSLILAKTDISPPRTTPSSFVRKEKTRVSQEIIRPVTDLEVEEELLVMDSFEHSRDSQEEHAKEGDSLKGKGKNLRRKKEKGKKKKRADPFSSSSSSSSSASDEEADKRTKRSMSHRLSSQRVRLEMTARSLTRSQRAAVQPNPYDDDFLDQPTSKLKPSSRPTVADRSLRLYQSLSTDRLPLDMPQTSLVKTRDQPTSTRDRARDQNRSQLSPRTTLELSNDDPLLLVPSNKTSISTQPKTYRSLKTARIPSTLIIPSDPRPTSLKENSKTTSRERSEREEGKAKRKKRTRRVRFEDEVDIGMKRTDLTGALKSPPPLLQSTPLGATKSRCLEDLEIEKEERRALMMLDKMRRIESDLISEEKQNDGRAVSSFKASSTSLPTLVSPSPLSHTSHAEQSTVPSRTSIESTESPAQLPTTHPQPVLVGIAPAEKVVSISHVDTLKSPKSALVVNSMTRYALHEEHPQARELMQDSAWRRGHTAQSETFLEGYYGKSRLHHLSNWKAELKVLVAQARCDSRSLPVSRVLAPHSLADSFLPRPASLTTSVKRSGRGERIIMHCDFDAFFVSVGLAGEERKALRGRPVVVCHSLTGGRQSTSEIASPSYEARAFGIKAGMSLGQAKRLCPEVKSIPYEFEKYKSTSLKFYTILLSYADSFFQAVSIDEALMEVTSRVNDLAKNGTERAGRELAERIREDIRQATGCEVSIGVASNTLLARLATRRAKPAGSFHLIQDRVSEFMESLDVADLWGIGRETKLKIEAAFKTTRVGELLKKRLGEFQHILGPKTGETVYNACRGIDSKPLKEESERRSVSAEVNYGVRFEKNSQAEDFLQNLSVEVSNRMKKVDRAGRMITLKIMKRAEGAPVEAPKFMGHGKCDVVNKSKELVGSRGGATDDPVAIGKAAVTLLKLMDIPASELRGIGIMITKLEDPVVISNLKKAGQTTLTFQKPDVASVPKSAQTSILPPPSPPTSAAPAVVAPPVDLPTCLDQSILDVALVDSSTSAPTNADRQSIHAILTNTPRTTKKPSPPPGTPLNLLPAYSQVDKETLAQLPSSMIRELYPQWQSTQSKPSYSQPNDVPSPSIQLVDSPPPLRNPSPVKKSRVDVSHIAKQLRPSKKSPMRNPPACFAPPVAGRSLPAIESLQANASRKLAPKGSLEEITQLAELLGWDLNFIKSLPPADLKEILDEGRRQRDVRDRLVRKGSGDKSNPTSAFPPRVTSLTPEKALHDRPGNQLITMIPTRSMATMSRDNHTTDRWKGDPPAPILGKKNKLDPEVLAQGQSIDCLREIISSWVDTEGATGPSLPGVQMVGDFVVACVKTKGKGHKERARKLLSWWEYELTERWPENKFSMSQDTYRNEEEEEEGRLKGAGALWWGALKACLKRLNEVHYLPALGCSLSLSK
ncbi:Translesion DNA polymerase-REV1 deoxycytidyl transferase [Phaffia rhodozyma]|uniref:DNA repair protein REV1 n=1 Tax=Phaffia rhodozyma TaxID=264483 RepID=A0A0F7SHT4_PHARH|nr:Translesion DNA polymerase-REV1 deoxycytidyl transferase [Phaffia rhodozyma]